MIISNPERPLDPAIEKTTFENLCDKAVPYVLLAAIVILLILVFVVMVKYGANWTGTEANQWQQMELII